MNRPFKKLNDIDNIFQRTDNRSRLYLYWWGIKDRVYYATPYCVRDFFYKHIKTIWAPKHSRIRKAVPRHWIDLDGILLLVNFEIIKSFYEEEFEKGIVDWEGSGPEAVKFASWLENAYKYITEERPALEKKMDEAYPDFEAKGTYKQLYKKVDYYEALIEKTDTKILTELVKFRKHLWT